MRKKAEPAPAADPVDEQIEQLAKRLQALEEQFLSFKQKVASNVTLPPD